MFTGIIEELGVCLLYTSELKHTSMKSMIVEVCFVEATEDVALYKKVGYDYIGKTIAEALVNRNSGVTPTPTPTPEPVPTPTPQPTSKNYDSWIARLQAVSYPHLDVYKRQL